MTLCVFVLCTCYNDIVIQQPDCKFPVRFATEDRSGLKFKSNIQGLGGPRAWALI